MLLSSRKNIVKKAYYAIDLKICIKVGLGHMQENVAAFNDILIKTKKL